MLGHNASLNKFTKIQIMPSIFSATMTDFKRGKTGKFTNMWNINNTLLKDHWVKEDIKREI